MKAYINGMMCMKCAARVEKALAAIGCEAKVDLENKCAVISGDVTEAAVREAVEKAGYTFVSTEKD